MSRAGGAGLLAEFASGPEALAALRRLRAEGYRQLDLHAPYDVPGASRALALPRPRIIPRLVLLFGLLGASGGYLVQWWTNVVDYPLLVGGRPLHAAPTFVPITFEMGVLFGAGAALFALIGTLRLGRLWQPIFEVPGIERATSDRAFVALAADDPRFEEARARRDLEALAPLRVWPPEEGP